MTEVEENENKAPRRKYNNKPLSPTYFKDYYRKKLAGKCECPLCGKIVGQQKLTTHQATRMCHLLSLEKMVSSEEKC
jgi:hypothetical protein